MMDMITGINDLSSATNDGKLFRVIPYWLYGIRATTILFDVPVEY